MTATRSMSRIGLAVPLAAVWLLSCGPTPEPDEPYAVKAKWARALRGSTNGPPAVAPDGTIYAAGGGELLALRPDGTSKWSLPVEHICFPVIGADGIIYLVTQDHVNYTFGLCAIDPAGSIRWRRILPGATPNCPGIAVASDGVVYCASDSLLIAIGSDSTLKWQLSLGALASSPPVVGLDSTVYVCSHGAISAVSPAGILKWRVEVTRYIDNPPVVAPDGRIYCVDNSGELFALDASGRERWRHRGWLPVIGTDSVVRFFAGVDTLCELHPDGTLGQRQAALMGQSALTNDGRIFCANGGTEFIYSSDARLDALNPDGSLLWTFKADGDHYVAWPPVVGPDGTVYLATLFNLYAVADSGSTAGCWWPMYQHDAQHTGRAVQP